MASVPFKIPDDHGHEISGLVYIEDEYLVFEVKVVKWSMFKQPTETIKAEMTVVDSIRLDTGIFGDSIYIVPKRSDLLDAVPGTHKGELRLKISKRYKQQAQELVAEVLAAKRSRV